MEQIASDHLTVVPMQEDQAVASKMAAGQIITAAEKGLFRDYFHMRQRSKREAEVRRRVCGQGSDYRT